MRGSKDIGAVWFLGDSITQSNADGDDNGSPRKSLYDLLTLNGYTFSFTGHYTANTDGLPVTGGTAATNLYHYHSGISGSVIGNDFGGRVGMAQGLPGFWTSGRLATVKPDVILIMLGTNDVDQGIDLPNAPVRLSMLLETIFAQPGVGDPTVLVASIPPNRTNLPGDPVNVAAFNAEVPGVVDAEVSMGRDVHFVDQFTPIEDDYAANMMSDNLHANATGNDTLAQQWMNKIEEIVGASLTVTGSAVALDTDNSAAAGMATAATYSPEILATDLSDASQSSLATAVLDKVPFNGINPGIAAFNDGLGHPTSGTATGAYLPAVFGGNGHLPFTYTVTLDTSANYEGYEITEIRSFAGWNQNGSALANQRYEVFVSVVGDPGFTSLGVVAYAPFDYADTREAAATKVVVTDASGVIATGVDALRFVIMDHGFVNGNASIDGSVFHEIDVIGGALPVISVTGFEAALDTDNSAAGGYATAATFSADISSSDLINVGQPSLVSAGWDKTPFFETDPVNDGDGHPTGSAAGTYLPVTFGGVHMPFTYTAILDTGVNSLGYKITEINSFAGWNQNGSALANQKYELLVSLVDDPDFTSLGTFTYAPFGDSDSREAAATKMVLSGTDGLIATGVDAVRFIAFDHGFANGNPAIDGSVFYEFDVIGSAVPVPSGAGISVVSSLAAMETDNSAAAGYATAATFSADISSTDLINAGQPTLSSAGWDKTPFFETDPVNDGDGHPIGSSAGTFLPATFGGGDHLPFTYTAYLAETPASEGYRITEVRSFAGWNQNGASLANQKYELLVSTVDSPGFASLGVFEFSPFTDSATEEAGATKLVLARAGGAIATGVDAVRFIVLDHGYESDDIAGSGVDGSVFFEFDVIGSTVNAGFDAWADSYGIPQNESDDSDHDSLSALLEYGLGFDPTMPDIMPSLVGAGPFFEITWPKGLEAAADSEITYAVRISNNLVDWLAPGAGEVVESASSITLSLDPAAGRRFARLEVIRSN